MAYYDEELRLLHSRCSRERHLVSRVNELNRQQQPLREQVDLLRSVMEKEQRDAEKMEGGSLAAFFWNVIGKQGEKLAKEQEEAYAARVKYDTAARELNAVEEDLRRSTGELDSLQGCHSRYEALLKEKAAAIKARGGAEGGEILRLEERLAYLDSQTQELGEAIQAGQEAQQAADSVLESLNSAENWGTWDLLGGGIIADIAKHGHLDDAQWAINGLQEQLRLFRTELADVTIHADIQVTVEGFLRFADYFFDGLFADWAVMDHIHQSQDRILSTSQEIANVLEELQTLVQATEEEKNGTRERLNKLITDTQIGEVK